MPSLPSQTQQTPPARPWTRSRLPRRRAWRVLRGHLRFEAAVEHLPQRTACTLPGPAPRRTRSTPTQPTDTPCLGADTRDLPAGTPDTERVIAAISRLARPRDPHA